MRHNEAIVYYWRGFVLSDLPKITYLILLCRSHMSSGMRHIFLFSILFLVHL